MKRDTNGEVVAVSREPLAGDDPAAWTTANGDEADVLAFTRLIAEAANPMGASDLGLVRVLEDLIELLIDRSLIRFTDLPLAAQDKLNERRGAREALQSLRLLDDDGII